MMFLFWIFRTKNVSRMPCCLVNIFCHAKPVIVILVTVQIIILTAIVLHLKGSFDLVNKWNHHSPAPSIVRFNEHGPVNLVFHLIDNEAVGFEPHGKAQCFAEGTMPGGSECRCRDGWHGADCGLHDIVWYVKGLQLKRRAHPRRIIHAFPAGSSTDMMEIRFQELRNAADVFIVAEKNQTASTELPVLTRLSRGWLQDFHDRILYVHHDNKSHPLRVLSEEVQHHLSNVRTDDIIVFASSDEIPAAEVLSSLKWYDGFPDTLAIFYQQSVYNFYSIPTNNTVKHDPVSPSITTVQYFLKDCSGKGACLVQLHPKDLVVVGSPQHPAGWRCTLCFQQFGASKHNYSHNIHIDKSVKLPKFLLKNERRYWYLLHARKSPQTQLNTTYFQNKTLSTINNDLAQTTIT